MELLELSEVLLLRFTGAQRFSSTSIKIDDCFLFQSFSIRFWGEFVLSKKSYKNPENDQFRRYYAGKYLRTFSIQNMYRIILLDIQLQIELVFKQFAMISGPLIKLLKGNGYCIRLKIVPIFILLKSFIKVHIPVIMHLHSPFHMTYS